MAASKEEVLKEAIKDEYRKYFEDYKAKFAALDAEKDDEIEGLHTKVTGLEGVVGAKQTLIAHLEKES